MTNTPSIFDDLDGPAQAAPTEQPVAETGNNISVFPPIGDTPPADDIDYTVEFGGREFTIGEPDLLTIIEITNAIGDIMLTSEQALAKRMSGAFTAVINGQIQSFQPSQATIFGLLSVLKIQHVIRLGALALFGGREAQKRDADQFFRDLNPDDLRLAPLIKAFAYRIQLSQDLAESLGNFRLAQGAVTAWGTQTAKKKK